MDTENKNQLTGSPPGQAEGGTGGGATKPPVPLKPPALPRGGLKGLRVSLMPAEEGEGRPNFQKRLLALSLVLVLETLVIGGIYFTIVQRTEANIQKRGTLMNRVEALGAEIREQEATAEELSVFNAQVGIISETLDEHLYWSGFMDFLEKNTKPGVRYEKFTGASGSGVVTLDAIALTYSDMAEQVMVFRNHPMMRSVRADSASTNVNDVGEVKGVSWTMTLVADPGLWKQGPAKPPGAESAEEGEVIPPESE